MVQTFSARVYSTARQMNDICAGNPQNAELIGQVFDTLASPWCNQEITKRAPFANDISDDASPYEFSLAVQDERADLRLLVEPQDAPYGLVANYRAGLTAHARLRAQFGVDTALFDGISEMFAPDADARGTFALWHGIVVKPDGRMLVKAYLNPRLHGDAHGADTVAKALTALGFDGALTYLRQMGVHAESVPYFSVDLCEANRARVKFYFAVRTLPEVERFVGDMASATAVLTGSTGPFRDRPVLICAGFRREDSVPELTLHVPVRCYVARDRQALALVEPFVAKAMLPRMEACVDVLDSRGEGHDVISYVSIKVGATRAVTLYLCPRLFAHAEQAASPVRLAPLSLPTMADVEEYVEAQAKQLLRHPFLARVDSSHDLAEFRTLLQRIGFFTLVFQDVLRLARAACRDESVARVCRDLERGDRGHDRWFLRDVQRLSVRLDLDVVFRSDYSEARDLTYELLGLVTGCQDDCARLSVLLVLEAAAELFFERVPDFARRCGIAEPLEYFGEKHLLAEQSHAIHQHGEASPLRAVRVSPMAQQAAQHVIERALQVMARLASDLDHSMQGAQAA